MDPKMKEFVLKVKAAERAAEAAKMKTKRIKNFIDEVRVGKGGYVCCQATNMSGKTCTFRATCGKYCRRHKI
jgi:hypothetical protein